MSLGRGETLVQQCSVIAQECDSESYLCFPDQDLCNPRCLGRFWTQWGECAEKINVFLYFNKSITSIFKQCYLTIIGFMNNKSSPKSCRILMCSLRQAQQNCLNCLTSMYPWAQLSVSFCIIAYNSSSQYQLPLHSSFTQYVNKDVMIKSD